jgi:NAD(P)-dependent dehydrogenase (short-subunit alcohol dehydrogenase family)
MKSIVVTGASTGIGWGCVKVLTAKGFHVYGSVRKQADADRLVKEFAAAFTPLLFDVTDEAAVHASARIVAGKLGGETLASSTMPASRSRGRCSTSRSPRCASSSM